MNIRRIEYNDDNSQIPLSELYIKRTESYERAIKSCHHMYIKKIINIYIINNNTRYFIQDIRHKYILYYISRLIAEMISMTFAVRGKIQQ